MFGTEEQEAYRDKIKAQLRQWEARLEELRARRQEAEADARLKLNRQLREASEQRQEALRKLRSLERRGLRWHEARDRLQSLADRLRETLREAAGRIKKRT